MIRAAWLSEDLVYRYMLTRQWDQSLPWVTVIGLNASKADAEIDDATIRRCVGFGKSWGCGGLVMLNLFAYRTPYPRELFKAVDPIGPENSVEFLVSTCHGSETITSGR